MSKGLKAFYELKANIEYKGGDFYCANEQRLNIIENRLKALEIIEELFDFDFALRFPTNQPMLRIMNKRTNEYWEIPIPKEKYDLLKEVLL